MTILPIPKFKSGDRIRRINNDLGYGLGLIVKSEYLDYYETYAYSILWDGITITVGYNPDQIDDTHEINTDYKEYDYRVLEFREDGYVWHFPLNIVAQHYARAKVKENPKVYDFNQCYDVIMNSKHSDNSSILPIVWFQMSMKHDDKKYWFKIIETPDIRNYPSTNNFGILADKEEI